MDDKFILASLNDENSKAIAEVLGNKTCKKILNFLAEVKEGSEKEISDKLNIPINTAEYNLKKLMKSGLINKTKNFFWSIKGKKIPMYKLAKKHIIIGYERPNLNHLKSILPVLITGFSAVFAKYLLQKIYVKDINEEFFLRASEKSIQFAGDASSGISNVSFFDKLISLPYFVWFLAGILAALIVIYLLNVRRCKL